jgi:hypothetical protein
LVIDHATRTKNEVAFVSTDLAAFADDPRSPHPGLHPDLQKEVLDSGAKVAYYRDLGGFVAKNSLAHFPVTEAWLSKYLAHETILEETRRVVEREGRGIVKDLSIESLGFETGSSYEVSENALYVEAAYSGSGIITVELLGTDIAEENITDFSGLLVSQLIPRIMHPNEDPQKKRYRLRFRFTLSMRVESDRLTDWQIDRFEDVLQLQSSKGGQTRSRELKGRLKPPMPAADSGRGRAKSKGRSRSGKNGGKSYLGGKPMKGNGPKR